MTFPRFDRELDRAIPFAVAMAGVALVLVDLVAGVILQVTDVSLPRSAVALAMATWAYRESRRSRPRVLPLVMVGGSVIAGGSLLSVTGRLPFGWYDEYTTYSIIVALGIVTAAVRHRGSWLRWGWAAAAGAWAVTYGRLAGRGLETSLDWAIVATATVAILHYLVGALMRAANSALDAQAGLADLHRALSRCSHLLLEDDSDWAMDRALEVLLEATDADYVCVDQTLHDQDPPGFRIVAEAASRPLPLEADWTEGTYGDLPTLLAAHREGRPCHVDVEELSGKERRLYENDGIRSELSVPIYVDGEWRGSMALVSFSRPRTWSPLELEIVVQAASLVGAYWRRRDDHRRLEKLVRSKDELIASVSHELRTPLTGVVGLAEEMAVSSRELDPDTVAELAGLVADQSRELAYLVEDLLVAARVESGALSIHLTEVNLVEEAREVVGAVMGGTAATVTGWEGTVEADPVRCRQILRNLLTNAQRYGGDRVEVTVEEEAETVVLTVSDDGDGVPTGDEERIFDPYVRSRVVAPGSIGVGLAVSRNLARLMGGDLDYRRHHGRTQFRLVLPRPARAETRHDEMAVSI